MLTVHANDPLTFLVYSPSGLDVRGVHDTDKPDVHPELIAAFKAQHAGIREQVLARPGGFDGHRAVMTGYRFSRGVLDITTAYRTYTEGSTLMRCLKNARRDGSLVLTEDELKQPRADISWGMPLNCFVLLPDKHVLCSQRGLHLGANAGRWTANNSEIIEPSDINPVDMQGLLSRLVDEELTSLRELGEQKYVGLGVRQATYTWQLVSIIDLRHLEHGVLRAALEGLPENHETAAWAACSLHAQEVKPASWCPDHFECPAGVTPDDIAIARFLSNFSD